MPLNPSTGEFYEEFTTEANTIPEEPITNSIGENFKQTGFINRLRNRTLRTPDFHILRFHKEIPLFVYGHEKQLGDNHNILRGATYHGMCHTLTDRFIMKTAEGHTGPVVFDCLEGQKFKNKIRGELYGVSVEHIHTLDNFLTNGIRFDRVERRFCAEGLKLDKSEGIHHYRGFAVVKGFMYLGAQNYWSSRKMNMVKSINFPMGTESLRGIPFFEYDMPQYSDDELMTIWGHELREPRCG